MKKRRSNQLLVFSVVVIAVIAIFLGFDSLTGITGSSIHRNVTNIGTSNTTTPPLVGLAVSTPVVDVPTQNKLKISSLQKEISTLKSKMLNVENDLKSLKGSSTTSTNELSRLNAEVRTTGTQQGQIENKVNKLSTGLSGLQEDVSSTQTNLEKIQEDLEKEQSSTTFLKYSLFFLIIVIVSLAIWMFMNKGNSGEGEKSSKKESESEIVKYINHHIKSGQKFIHIKAGLLKAGWPEGAIQKAYKETTKRNYQKYLKKEGRPTGPKLHSHKNKIVVITIFTLVVLIGMLFLLKGVTTGKAIHLQDSFRGDEIFKCTPPHIVTGEGGCCLDEDANNVCDEEELYEKERVEVSVAVCNDHRECVAGEVCIDNKCGVIHDLYNTDCPTVDQCNMNNIEILTSDGETYNINGREGSYTAAGAIAWTVLPVPNYCDDQEVRVPIEIVKNGLVCRDGDDKVVTCSPGMNRKSEVLSKQIITLKAGETSNKITRIK